MHSVIKYIFPKEKPMFPMNDQFASLFKNFQPANEQFAFALKAVFPGNTQFSDVAKNMFPANEQFINAVKTSLEAQVSYLATLTAKAFESTEKVVDLNLNAAKASMEESTVIARQLLASKDLQEFLSLAAALPQPTAAKAMAYSRHLANIASDTQAEFTRVTEERLAETGRKFSALFDAAANNAPAGSETAIAMMKSALANASAGYEQFTKTTKQAGEVIEANVSNVVNQASQVVEQAANTTAQTRK